MHSRFQGRLAVAGLREAATTTWLVGQITGNSPSSKNSENANEPGTCVRRLDHTAKPAATLPFVLHALSIAQDFFTQRPHVRTTASRPPHAAPRFVTTGVTPVHRSGMER